ncbi:Charged multivesicular body protein 7 [Fasciola hepatica]|uniref:Charged multivesicular body protein 7 n=1 Tax=Fasciola hepatica TaxID=6192 RepID=A0A4E0R5M1_FASHE|nr:Charged multivesicular body protein 7 [Fasciola hepatica]
MADKVCSSPRNFVLPPIWDDDDAMFSLMQPIRRPKHVDPEAYIKKVKFWEDLLLSYAKHQRVAVVSVQSLQTVFARYFIEEGIQMVPQCLPEVFVSLLESGKLESIEAHSGLLHTVLKTGFNYLIKAPLEWTSRLVFGDANTSDNSVGTTMTKLDPEQQFAFTDLSEQLASQFINLFTTNYKSRRLTLRLPVYELDDFDTALAEFLPHDATRWHVKRLCTELFHCLRFETVSDPEGTWSTQVVRVSDGLENPLPLPSKKSDSQTEMSVLGGLAHTRAVVRQLEAEEQKLATEIEERRNRIKMLMKQNRVREAKSLLQRTKILEKSLATRQTHLHHLEAMQLQIDSASDNHTVLCALADSGRALQQITGGTEGLTKIEDTMHDIADSVQDSNEFSDLLSSLGRTSAYTDEDELEKELRSLLIPEREVTKPQPASKNPNLISDTQLEAELAALSLDQLRFPEVPGTPITPPEKTKSSLPT